jgi:hypothetical protein
MSMFVTPDDYKRKPRPSPPVEGAGTFASKREVTTLPHTGKDDARSQVELAAVRVAKFVPSLVLVAYAGFCNLANSKDPTSDAELRLILFRIAFFLCLVITPCYIVYFTRGNPCRWRNCIVGTLAFCVWAYAFPCGWFVDTRVYDPVFAGFGVMAFSLLTACVPAPNLNGGNGP